MSTKKLPNILDNYFVQLFCITVGMLIVVFAQLEAGLEDVSFIYNNF